MLILYIHSFFVPFYGPLLDCNPSPSPPECVGLRQSWTTRVKHVWQRRNTTHPYRTGTVCRRVGRRESKSEIKLHSIHYKSQSNGNFGGRACHHLLGRHGTQAGERKTYRNWLRHQFVSVRSIRFDRSFNRSPNTQRCLGVNECRTRWGC